LLQKHVITAPTPPTTTTTTTTSSPRHLEDAKNKIHE
jgi:hypothetical protein